MTNEGLEARIRRLEDIEEVKKLQSTYQHYVHMYNWDGIVSMFALKSPDVSVEIGSAGLYEGAASIRRNFERIASARKGRKGTVLLHLGINPVVEISKDGKTAKGLWFGPGVIVGGEPGNHYADFVLGKYACDFLKEDGKWKIWHMKWYMHAKFDRIWEERVGEGGAASDLQKAYALYQPDRPGVVPEVGYDPDREDNTPLPPPPQSY